MPDVLRIAARALGRPLTAVARLRGSDRSSVVRATVDGGPRTVVVKAHDPAYADHWRRESAALALVRGRGLPVPELLATVDDPPLVVLADAGSGPNLADALLGDSAATATDRLHAWADALATLHTVTHGVEPEPSIVDPMPALLADAADMLVESLPALGVTPGAQALADLRAGAGGFTTRADALTPADACPDNNVLTPNGLVLLDFEQACVRHVAWDAAYLLVPWPSCWCSWGLPDEVAAAALDRWRSGVRIPAVHGGEFGRDLDVAVVVWAVMSSAWFLAGAIEEEHEAERADLPGPTRRTVIRHRMRLVTRRRTTAPALAALADDVLAATGERWGDRRLEVAPAYR
jgi:Ser/Thr protein kinase RdoA (MazF antagonist)